jgi:hypothetical protein
MKANMDFLLPKQGNNRVHFAPATDVTHHPLGEVFGFFRDVHVVALRAPVIDHKAHRARGVYPRRCGDFVPEFIFDDYFHVSTLTPFSRHQQMASDINPVLVS